MNKYTMFLLTLMCLSFSLCNVGCTNKQDEVQLYNTTEDTVMFNINIADDEYIYTD